LGVVSNHGSGYLLDIPLALLPVKPVSLIIYREGTIMIMLYL
jgi:hypothetical protein